MPSIIEKERHVKSNHLDMLYKSFILKYLGWQEFLESPYSILHIHLLGQQTALYAAPGQLCSKQSDGGLEGLIG